MRLEDFASQFREKTGDKYNDWTDNEILKLVEAKKPNLLNKINQQGKRVVISQGAFYLMGQMFV